MTSYWKFLSYELNLFFFYPGPPYRLKMVLLCKSTSFVTMKIVRILRWYQQWIIFVRVQHLVSTSLDKMNDFQKNTFWVILLKTYLNFGLKQLNPLKQTLSINYDQKVFGVVLGRFFDFLEIKKILSSAIKVSQKFQNWGFRHGRGSKLS